MKQKRDAPKSGLISLIIELLHAPLIKKPPIDPELQKAIDECTTTDQLTELLFATTLNNEAEVDAFDKRFTELERAL